MILQKRIKIKRQQFVALGSDSFAVPVVRQWTSRTPATTGAYLKGAGYGPHWSHCGHHQEPERRNRKGRWAIQRDAHFGASRHSQAAAGQRDGNVPKKEQKITPGNKRTCFERQEGDVSYQFFARPVPLKLHVSLMRVSLGRVRATIHFDISLGTLGDTCSTLSNRSQNRARCVTAIIIHAGGCPCGMSV